MNEAGYSMKHDIALQDGHGRVHDYLRLSVTDKCNLRCRYCMPPEGITTLSHDEVLRNEEFLRLMTIFRGLGVKKIRFTGGEPLVRRGFIDLAARAAGLMLGMELCLTTNGLLLENHLESLRDIGLRKINISLDTLSPERYRYLTGDDGLTKITGAIERALGMDAFHIKVNAVLFKETVAELDGLLDYFKDKNVVLRFIELMPIGGPGNGLDFISVEDLADALSRRGTLSRNGPGDTRVARMYRYLYRGLYPMELGLIPPVSDKFCSRCNRVRLSCGGQLRVCLCGAAACDLKAPLRDGASDERIAAIIRECLAQKPLEHRITCGETDRTCAHIPSMSKIGG